MEISVHSIEVPAGHRLLGYDGRCAYLHGHNYVFSVSVEGNPNAIGLVLDYTDLKTRIRSVLDQFDHSMVLNGDDPFVSKLGLSRLVLLNCNPSAENIASLVFTLLYDTGLKVTRVECHESMNTSAVATRVNRQVRILEVRI